MFKDVGALRATPLSSLRDFSPCRISLGSVAAIASDRRLKPTVNRGTSLRDFGVKYLIFIFLQFIISSFFLHSSYGLTILRSYGLTILRSYNLTVLRSYYLTVSSVIPFQRLHRIF